MARLAEPATTLRPLQGLVVIDEMSFGAQSIEVEYKDGREWVIANKGAVGISIANYKSSSAHARELGGATACKSLTASDGFFRL